METKNIINIPEGFEIDKKQSTERKIILKKIEDDKVRSWDEYCKKVDGNNSFYYDDGTADIWEGEICKEPNLSEFEDKEDVESLVAFVKLLKLRKDWVGDWKPDWKNVNEAKYLIVVDENEITNGRNYSMSRPLSFPTEEMRDEFLDCFKDLLEIAKPLL